MNHLTCCIYKKCQWKHNLAQLEFWTCSIILLHPFSIFLAVDKEIRALSRCMYGSVCIFLIQTLSYAFYHFVRGHGHFRAFESDINGTSHWLQTSLEKPLIMTNTPLLQKKHLAEMNSFAKLPLRLLQDIIFQGDWLTQVCISSVIMCARYFWNRTSDFRAINF